MNETQVAPHRPYFRFGLRTMFVVLTVVSLWLGWQAKIVRDRRKALALHAAEIPVLAASRVI